MKTKSSQGYLKTMLAHSLHRVGRKCFQISWIILKFIFSLNNIKTVKKRSNAKIQDIFIPVIVSESVKSPYVLKFQINWSAVLGWLLTSRMIFLISSSFSAHTSHQLYHLHLQPLFPDSSTFFSPLPQIYNLPEVSSRRVSLFHVLFSHSPQLC